MKDITVLLVIKDRSETITRNCIDSLLNQTYPCDVIVVDFGSSEENLKWERKVFSKVKFIEVKRNVEYFNKCRALNIALKATETPYVVQSDIDMIFAPNFVEEVVKVLKADDKAIVLCQRITLDKEGNECGLFPQIALGACTGLLTTWLKSVHGWDEKYTYHGREDNDIVQRAEQVGFKQVWITDKTWLKHQWHPTAPCPTLQENIRYYDIPNKPLVRNLEKWGEL